MRNRLKRILTTVAIVVVGALLAVGYGYLILKDDSDKNQKPQRIKVEGPRKGGRIRIGLAQEPTTLNPFLPEGSSPATKLITANIFWGLLVQTPNLKYAPRIAESVPTVENGLVKTDPFTVIYEIKEDAQWSDGTPITAADIKFTWEAIMDPRNSIADRSGYDKIERIDTPYEKTARIVFKEPYAAYKELFSTTYPILPKHKLEGKSINNYLNDVVTFSSGPYKFKEWKRGDHLTLVRNDSFWEDEPYIDKVTFKFISGTREQATMLSKGQVDVVYPVFEPEALSRFKSNGNLTAKVSPGLVWEQVGFNVSKPPLNDINVRAAIIHAINRSRIAREVTGRREALNSILVPEQSPFYEAAWKQYDFNIEKSRRLLEGAGYQAGQDNIFAKDGVLLKITISTAAGDPIREKTQRVMRDDLRKAGIDLVINNHPPAIFFNETLPDGDFEVGIWAWFSGLEPQIGRFFAGSEVPPAGQNYYRYDNASVNALLDSAGRDISTDDRANTYRRIQQKISEDVITVPLYQHPQIIAYNRKIGGIINNTTYEGPFWDLSKWWISRYQQTKPQ